MGMTSAQYLSMLQALLPSGTPWPRTTDAVLTKLLNAWADEFAREGQRVDALLQEMLPTQAVELLPDWERVLGLPDEATANMPLTFAQRQFAVTAKLLAIGGQSKAYFIGIAASLGIPNITITEFTPCTCQSACDAPLISNADSFIWLVNILTAVAVDVSMCDSPCDLPLQSFARNAILEYTVNKFKPAHTTALFSYY